MQNMLDITAKLDPGNVSLTSTNPNEDGRLTGTRRQDGRDRLQPTAISGRS